VVVGVAKVKEGATRENFVRQGHDKETLLHAPHL